MSLNTSDIMLKFIKDNGLLWFTLSVHTEHSSLFSRITHFRERSGPFEYRCPLGEELAPELLNPPE